jgi:hypothetical protein
MGYSNWGKRRKAGTGGEGSRGGVVIGHTKNGHPIYAPHEGHHDAGSSDLVGKGHEFAGEHSTGYKRADHFQAANAILKKANEARAAGKTSLAYHLGAVAAGHKNLARGKGPLGQQLAKTESPN